MAFVSTKEAAAILGLSPYELRRGFQLGIYPGLRVGEAGKKFKFDPEIVLEAIRNRKPESEETLCGSQFNY